MENKKIKSSIEIVCLIIMSMLGLVLFGFLIYFGLGKIIHQGIGGFFGAPNTLSNNVILAVLGVLLWVFLYALVLFLYIGLIYFIVATLRFIRFHIRKDYSYNKDKAIVYIIIAITTLVLGVYVAVLNIPFIWGWLGFIVYGLCSVVCFFCVDGLKQFKKEKNEENKIEENKIEENKKEVE